MSEKLRRAMGWSFEKRAALVPVFSLLLLLTAEAAACGDHPSSSSMLNACKLLNFSSIPIPPAGEQSSPRGGAGHHSMAWMGPDDYLEEDVVVYQSSVNPLSSGVSAYTVQIFNVCGGCTVSDVHVSCGDFASTELVDPGKFQRIDFNDCIVKGGGSLERSETIFFQYSNSFSYQLHVASVVCE